MIIYFQVNKICRNKIVVFFNKLTQNQERMTNVPEIQNIGIVPQGYWKCRKYYFPNILQLSERGIVKILQTVIDNLIPKEHDHCTFTSCDSQVNKNKKLYA